MDGYRGPAEEGSEVTLVFLPLLLLAQNPELGRIAVRGGEATLSVDYPRPMDSAVQTLVHEYGLPISCEDPPYVYAGEMETIPDVRFPVPKRQQLEDAFPANSRRPIRSLAQAVVDAANAELPYAFQIEKVGAGWTVIPGQGARRSGHGGVSSRSWIGRSRSRLPPGRSTSTPGSWPTLYPPKRATGSVAVRVLSAAFPGVCNKLPSVPMAKQPASFCVS